MKLQLANSKHVRKATLRDVHDVVKNIREADKREVEEWSGVSTIVSMTYSFHVSTECYAGVDASGKPVVVFGFVDQGSEALVWAICSKEIHKNIRPFMSETKRIVSEMLDRWTVLYNWADMRNKLHVKWLKHIGATFFDNVAESTFKEFIITKRKN